MENKTFIGNRAVFVGVLALIGALVAVGIAAAAFAGRAERPAHFAAHIAEDLALNDAQEERLRAMMTEAREKREQLRAQSAAEIRAVVLQDAMSREDARNLMQLRRHKREEMRDFIAEKIVAFHSGLDAAQREKLADIAPRLLSRMMRDNRRGRGRHRDKHSQ